MFFRRKKSVEKPVVEDPHLLEPHIKAALDILEDEIRTKRETRKKAIWIRSMAEQTQMPSEKR